VYRPALKCKQSTLTSLDKHITKVQTVNHSREEVANSNRFYKIDPTQRYFVSKVQDTCAWDELAPTAQQEIASTCTIKLRGRQRFSATSYTYGGTSLYQWANNSTHGTIRIELLLSMFIHLCDGLAKIHDQDVFHHDITPLNIVLAPGSYHPRFIDFGLSNTVNTLMKTDNSIFIKSYLYWPIEAILLLAYGKSPLLLARHTSYVTQWQKDLTSPPRSSSLLPITTSGNEYISELAYSTLGVELSYTRQETQKIINKAKQFGKLRSTRKSTPTLSNEERDELRGIARRVDVYALIIVLVECLFSLEKRIVGLTPARQGRFRSKLIEYASQPTTQSARDLKTHLLLLSKTLIAHPTQIKSYDTWMT
jgi:serine/threonine protein kinase